MQELHLSLWAVLGAGAARFVLGGIWYSKMIFAKEWAKLTGFKEKQKKDGAAMAMLVEFLGNILMAFVLAHAIRYAQAQGAAQGMMVGFFNWLGFVATVTLGSVLFEKKPLKLFFINNGFQLLSMIVMSVILVTWA